MHLHLYSNTIDRFPWSIVPQYGTMTELGHVDFYPGSTYYQDWGWNQPGCWQVEDVGSCSHSRSHDLFISSITRPCHALQTCSDTEDIPAPVSTSPTLLRSWDGGQLLQPWSQVRRCLCSPSTPPQQLHSVVQTNIQDQN